MGATLLDGVVVEKSAMVAAGSLVKENTRIPSGEVLLLFTFLVVYCLLRFVIRLPPNICFVFVK